MLVEITWCGGGRGAEYFTERWELRGLTWEKRPHLEIEFLHLPRNYRMARKTAH